MASLAAIFTHFVISPIAYYIFGRHRISRRQLAEVSQNVNLVLGILCAARTKLEIVPWNLLPLEMGSRAMKLLKELKTTIDDICADNSAMGHFWFRYDGVLSRWSMTEEEIVYGRNRFRFWLDGEARQCVAAVMRKEAAEMVEAANEYYRQREILRRVN